MNRKPRARKKRNKNGDFDIFQLSGGIRECAFGARISFLMPYHRQSEGLRLNLQHSGPNHKMLKQWLHQEVYGAKPVVDGGLVVGINNPNSLTKLLCPRIG